MLSNLPAPMVGAINCVALVSNTIISCTPLFGFALLKLAPHQAFTKGLHTQLY
jgi:hypothetical protein